ncbi:MAG: poly(hydroxyalkanoate) granule-associated protein [Chloroflexi bacterium]|nr:MAG: poly(hydroxyalkanoate) granule-associated protein [Chloroflexota bacterium]
MAEKTKIDVVEEEVAEESNSFLSGVRRVLLAGVGAVALAQEEIEDFVNKLVERGEIAEKDGRKLLNDIMEKRRQKAEESRQSVAEELDRRLESLLARMNVPTRRDIESLSEKINELSKKVDELKKKKAASK